MRRRIWFVTPASLLTALLVCLPMQAQVTETITTDLRLPYFYEATNPWRVVETRTEQGGRTIETRMEGSIGGVPGIWTETEQESFQPNPNSTTVVQRQYFRNADRKRVLIAVVEEQRSTAADGRETVVRTTSRADANESQYIRPQLQVVQRAEQEAADTGDGTRHITSVVFEQRASGLVPVQRSETLLQPKGDVTEQQVTVLVPDLADRFVAVARSESTTTKTASGQTEEERSYGDTGLGQMDITQRDVTTESTDNNVTDTTVETYSAFVPGRYLSPGALELVQEVNSSRETAPDGSSHLEEEVQAIDLVDPDLALLPVTSVVSVSHPAPREVGRSQDGNRSTLQITDSHGTRSLP